jgi:hypothetical protein
MGPTRVGVWVVGVGVWGVWGVGCECVGVWVCGCVVVWGVWGVWVCGCVDVWVCGCVGVSLPSYEDRPSFLTAVIYSYLVTNDGTAQNPSNS